MRTSAILFAFLGLSLFSVLSCSRTQNAVLTIQLPEAQVLGKVSAAATSSTQNATGFSFNFDDESPWNGASITASSEINCYAVMVGGPEVEMKRNSCWDDSLKTLFKFGVYEGGLPAGTRLELNVPVGPDRKIYLLGMHATSGACINFKGRGLVHDKISVPRIVAQTTMSLAPGTNVVDLSVPKELNDAKEILNCRTDENGGDHLRPGDTLPNGTIYLGTLQPGAISGGSNVDRYVTTPGGCSGSPATCSGNDSVKKMWWSKISPDPQAEYDIPGLTNYTNTMGTGHGSTNTDQNYGDANTAVIVSSDSDSAAAYCNNLVYGGYSNWYLPNRYELNLMFKNKDHIPGLVKEEASELSNDSVYWSSSENNEAQAWAQRMSNGSQVGDSPKSYAFLVRCVRRMTTLVLLTADTTSITDLDVTGTPGASASSSWEYITLTNSGELSTGGLSFSITGDSHLSASDPNNCAAGIASHQSCTLQVQAASLDADRLISGALIISAANGGSVRIALSGTASGFYVEGTDDDPCMLNPNPGDTCDGDTIYMGRLDKGATTGSGPDYYMTTPSGCNTSGTCSGPDVIKSWGPEENLSLHDYNDNTYSGPGYGEYNTDEKYGDDNTSVIAAAAPDSAAAYCNDLSYGGYIDWYLPNRYELNLLYTHRNSIANLSNYYWSSTEFRTSNAWRQNFSNGAQQSSYKGISDLIHVRCVRRYSK